MSTATAPAPAKGKTYRFRILSGTYWHPMPVIDEETGQPVKDKNGKVLTRDVIFGPGRPAGDIVEVATRLDKKHNKPESKLFQLLDENDNPMVDQLRQAEERVLTVEQRYRRSLAQLNQRGLIDLAEKEGVDLRGETDKEKVRATLLAAAGLDPKDPT